MVEGSNIVVAAGLFIFLLACTAIIFYWAATIDNDIENNPDK